MKILQITYYYPPMGGAGVQRALKFSKYLPRHGVTPIVLACDDLYIVTFFDLTCSHIFLLLTVLPEPKKQSS